MTRSVPLASEAVEAPPGLRRVLAAIHLRSPTAFDFPSAVPAAAAGPREPVSPAMRGRLEEALRDRLYSAAFARPLPGAAESVAGGLGTGASVFAEPNREDAALGPEELASRLREANQGRERWLAGWRIESVRSSGEIVAARGDLRRSARFGDYALTFSEDLRPFGGAAATLRLAVDSLTLQAGVYTVFGEALPEPGDRSPALRLYLATAGAALPDLYAVLTGELNRRQVPFTLKSMLVPGERHRLDATVLYLPRRHHALARRVADWLSGQTLGPAVPLFTAPLAPGIGLAQSPGNGESFGMHRCRLLAEGVVEAWLSGHQDVTHRLQAVAERFRAAHLDLAQPHRGRIDGRALAPSSAAPPGAPTAAVEQSIALCTERGWLPAGVRWQATDVTRRNSNVALRAVSEVDGDAAVSYGFFLKKLRVMGEESRRMMEREAAVYRLASRDPACAALGDLLPRFHGFDRASGILLLDLVEDGATLVERQRSGARAARTSAAALGRALALLHGQVDPSTRLDPGLFPRQVPGIFTAHRGGPLLDWLSSGQKRLVEEIGKHPLLASILDAAVADWRFDCFTHGDLKWQNALLERSGRLYLVDWELADVGDAAWDVGSGLQDWIAEAVRRPGHRLELRAAARAYWAAYHTSPAVAFDAASFDRRCRVCAAARLLQAALEEMRAQDPQSTIAPAAGSLPRRLVDQAISLLENLNDADPWPP
ncbi:MAG: T3SS effector HopA1 family protein [Acidobacteriota bacterium]